MRRIIAFLLCMVVIMTSLPVSAAETKTINNASLMPKYKPDSQVKLEGYSPDWIKSLIMAELRIETATPEGTFQAATKVLDHYQEMGVNGLWVTPIYQRDEDERIASQNNGYGSYGPGTMDNQLTGTNDYNKQLQVVKNFVDEAHKRNIRIIFDIVVWGVSKTAPIVQEHPEYFKDENGNYNEVWGGYGYRWSSPEWQEWYVSTAANWLTKVGADGYRVDLEPTITGYGVFLDLRTRLAKQGKYIMLMAEGTNERRDTYDVEQNAVGWYMKNGAETLTINYYLKNNIVDSVTSGIGIGDAKLQSYSMGGRYRFYVCNIANHDTYNAVARGNRLSIGYQSIFAPFIPMWYIGEEWDNPYSPTNGAGPLYYNKIDWEAKEEKENQAFFEDVKKYIQIRRTYTDIFEYFPSNHRESNILKLDTVYQKGNEWVDNSLQAYVRYGTDKAILIVPNNTTKSAKFRTTLNFSAMKIGGAKGYRITDLYTGKVLLDKNAGDLKNLETTIESKNMGIYLVEMTTGAGGDTITKPPLGSVTSTSSATTSSNAPSSTAASSRPGSLSSSASSSQLISSDGVSSMLSSMDSDFVSSEIVRSDQPISSEEKPGSNVWWIILIVIFVLAGAGAGVWFWIYMKKKQRE